MQTTLQTKKTKIMAAVTSPATLMTFFHFTELSGKNTENDTFSASLCL